MDSLVRESEIDQSSLAFSMRRLPEKSDLYWDKFEKKISSATIRDLAQILKGPDFDRVLPQGSQEERIEATKEAFKKNWNNYARAVWKEIQSRKDNLSLRDLNLILGGSLSDEVAAIKKEAEKLWLQKFAELKKKADSGDEEAKKECEYWREVKEVMEKPLQK